MSRLLMMSPLHRARVTRRSDGQVILQLDYADVTVLAPLPQSTAQEIGTLLALGREGLCRPSSNNGVERGDSG